MFKIGSSRRLLGSLVVLLVLSAAIVGGAVAAFPDTNVDTYTGCLNIGGTSGGQIGQVAVGLSPLKPCGSNQKLVHLSGGDITKVTAGSGLTASPAGGDNGAVTLSLDGAHSLPQGCTSGQVAKSNGSNTWNCGNDNDTTYSAGTGLTLSGTQFSIASEYRVKNTPDCDSGKFATGFDDSSGEIRCAAPTTGAVAGYWTSGHSDLAGTETVVSKSLPAGNYLILGNVAMQNVDISSESTGDCRLVVGNDTSDFAGLLRFAEAGEPADRGWASLSVGADFAGGTVKIECTEEDADVEVDASLAAIRVDSLG
jgi:hypothetical protein